MHDEDDAHKNDEDDSKKVLHSSSSSSKLSIIYIDYNVLKAGLLCKEVKFIPWEWEEELEPLILEHFGLSMFHAWINI